MSRDCFRPLSVTGFHRQIAREADPATVAAAVGELQSECASLSIAAAVGAPTFGEDGTKFISHLLIVERGEISAKVSKQGLTAAEGTFFQAGASRPVGRMQGLRCSAVICREVEDHEYVSRELPHGSVDLIFVPAPCDRIPRSHEPTCLNTSGTFSVWRVPPVPTWCRPTGPTRSTGPKKVLTAARARLQGQMVR